MRRRDGLKFLCKDGDLLVPCSRYGNSTFECAPIAWRLAFIMARETGEELTLESLDYAMGLVVNDHDDVTYMIRQYGNYDYGYRKLGNSWHG